jgi:hypothetical protein
MISSSWSDMASFPCTFGPGAGGVRGFPAFARFPRAQRNDCDMGGIGCDL